MISWPRGRRMVHGMPPISISCANASMRSDVDVEKWLPGHGLNGQSHGVRMSNMASIQGLTGD